MCIIRQLINQHSIIDSYPMMAMLDKSPDHAPRKPRRQEDITDPPTDDSESSQVDDDDTSVLSEMELLPQEVSHLPPPGTRTPPPPAPVMSDKIAQDVLVFKKIAERMPPQSLLHLLKADVLVQLDTTIPSSKNTNSSGHVIDAQDQVEKEAHHEQQPQDKHVLAPLRASKVRFARNEQGKVRRDTRYFEPCPVRCEQSAPCWQRTGQGSSRH